MVHGPGTTVFVRINEMSVRGFPGLIVMNGDSLGGTERERRRKRRGGGRRIRHEEGVVTWP